MATTTKPSALLARLKPYLNPYWWTIFAVILLAIPMAAIKGASAKLLQYLTDHVLVARDEKALQWLPLLIIGLFSANFVVRFLHHYLIRAVATRAIQQFRNDLYSHLMRLSLGYFGEARGGKLVSRVILDVNQVSVGISSINQFIAEPLLFIGMITYIFYLNWRLAALTILVSPLVAILLGNTGKHTKRYTHSIQEAFSELSAILTETFAGMRVIKGFNLESFMRGQFMVQNRDLSRTILKAIRVEELGRPGMELITGFAIAGVLYYGGSEVMRGKMSPGEMMAFLAGLGFIVNSVRTLGDMGMKYNQCLASLERVLQMFDETPDISDGPSARELPKLRESIEFRGVSYAYPGGEAGRRVVDNFSLKIRKGEMVALVGPSGAGKSTLLSLIPRFFDPDSGQILVDGQDIRDFKVKSLREQIALVTQEVFLFHDTVRSNIRAGNFMANDSDMIDAASAAQALKFIEAMPQGFDTLIGDRGQKLSGGERQRLSIARAILRDAPILLLDEATSALDAENERLVQAALDNLLKGKTSIVVAHRLSTIRRADRIVVLEEGRISEIGSHRELLDRGGPYAKALSLQEGFSRA